MVDGTTMHNLKKADGVLAFLRPYLEKVTGERKFQFEICSLQHDEVVLPISGVANTEVAVGRHLCVPDMHVCDERYFGSEGRAREIEIAEEELRHPDVVVELKRYLTEQFLRNDKLMLRRRLSCISETSPCYACSSSGRSSCSSCGGVGKQRCGRCGGSGWQMVSRPQYNYRTGQNDYLQVNEFCTSCSGSGTTYCYSCSGNGKVTCQRCAGGGSVTEYLCFSTVASVSYQYDSAVADRSELLTALFSTRGGNVLFDQNIAEGTLADVDGNQVRGSAVVCLTQAVIRSRFGVHTVLIAGRGGSLLVADAFQSAVASEATGRASRLGLVSIFSPMFLVTARAAARRLEKLGASHILLQRTSHSKEDVARAESEIRPTVERLRRLIVLHSLLFSSLCALGIGVVQWLEHKPVVVPFVAGTARSARSLLESGSPFASVFFTYMTMTVIGFVFVWSVLRGLGGLALRIPPLNRRGFLGGIFLLSLSAAIGLSPAALALYAPIHRMNITTGIAYFPYLGEKQLLEWVALPARKAARRAKKLR